ncbi:hypothetical protein [Hydrogenophaga sp. 5NK40-0174]
MTRISLDGARRRPIYTAQKNHWGRKLGQFILAAALVWMGLGLPGLAQA